MLINIVEMFIYVIGCLYFGIGSLFALILMGSKHYPLRKIFNYDKEKDCAERIFITFCMMVIFSNVWGFIFDTIYMYDPFLCIAFILIFMFTLFYHRKYFIIFHNCMTALFIYTIMTVLWFPVFVLMYLPIFLKMLFTSFVDEEVDKKVKEFFHKKGCLPAQDF